MCSSDLIRMMGILGKLLASPMLSPGHPVFVAAGSFLRPSLFLSSDKYYVYGTAKPSDFEDLVCVSKSPRLASRELSSLSLNLPITKPRTFHPDKRPLLPPPGRFQMRSPCFFLLLVGVSRRFVNEGSGLSGAMHPTAP